MPVHRATDVFGLSPEFVFPSGVFPWPDPSPGAAPDGKLLRSIEVPSAPESVVVTAGMSESPSSAPLAHPNPITEVPNSSAAIVR